MTPKQYWTLYADDMPPAEFVWTFGKGDLDASVEEYLRRRAHLHGVVRRGTWKETFQAKEQLNRSCVATGLKVHLEETKQSWISEIVAFAEAEAEALARAQAETQARMLEEAMARVEAEAQAQAKTQQPPADAELTAPPEAADVSQGFPASVAPHPLAASPAPREFEVVEEGMTAAPVVPEEMAPPPQGT